MPFLRINFADIVFDPKVQTYCINPNFKCPSYEHSWTCPPEAPYLEQEVSQYKEFYIIFVKFNLRNYIEKEKARHPSRTEKSIRNAFFMKNLLRDDLEQEIKLFFNQNQTSYEEKLILWDGFCRVCSNERDKGCTYDAGDPCRYPDNKRFSMEAVGIDVSQTVENLKFKIEWPPNDFVYRFGLVCLK